VCVLGGRKDCTSCVWLQNQFCSWVTPYSNPTPLHLSAPYTLHRGPYPLPLSTHSVLSDSFRTKNVGSPCLCLKVCSLSRSFVFKMDTTPYTLHPAPWAIRTLPLSTHSSSRKERWFTLSLSEGLFAQSFVCVQSGYYTLHPTPYTLHRGPYPLPLSTHSSSHKERWFTLSLSEGLFAQVFVCVQSGYYTLHPTPYTLQVKSL
jgi:hypothetical protein